MSEDPTIEELYQDYDNMQALLDVTLHDQRQLVQGILTDEQKRQIEEIETEYADMLAEARNKLKATEAALKAAVIESGESYKSSDSMHHVTLSKGRVKWDNKALNDMVFDFPLLINARSKGDPFVTIRKKK